ncbi:clt [Drosophila busckii]|uniref:carboxylesterase n=2 Tax=Drosophila busckii TaxID=30019 RepID=A0A0M4EW70_DROBS|nr:clt [Drosophila busckii]
MKKAVAVKVPVKQGVLVGQQHQLPSGLTYDCFLGVPYAEPPVGALRYRSPVPLERFEQFELNCSQERSVSHQRDPFTQEVIGSENCLFLNIYVPKSELKSPLPVMVWIHGGGFWFGNGNKDYTFPAQLLQQEVIVVTLNYRLGALGFLSLPEAGIFGNAGLKDQRLALEWIQQNIANFNGDQQNVTLFGESAGAASVHLHAYAAHANKLFHKAILQSGTGNMEWVFQQEASYKARRLGELLHGQQLEQPHNLLRFLQSPEVTPLALLANTLNVLTPDERRRHLPLTFKPVIEDPSSPDSFISQPILDLMLQKDRLKGLPMLMGYNSAEGIGMIMNATKKLELFDEDLARLVPRNLVVNPRAPEAEAAADDIRQFYLNGQSLTPDRLDNLVDILSDFHFNIDLQNAAEIHVHRQTQSPLYFYRFDYVGGRNIYKRMLASDKLRGASHGDELFYLFQMADDQTPVAADDVHISECISQMWANFARSSKPLENWTPVRRPKSQSQVFQLDYMCIDRALQMRQNPDAERIDFWRSMYKRYTPQCYEAIRAKL